MSFFTLPDSQIARIPAVGRLALASAGLALATLLPDAVRAQAPTWQDAFSGNSNQPTSGTSDANATAVDAAGNVYVAGSFSGQVTFGNIRLVSAGGQDTFVAKWDATAKTWTSVVRGGGTGIDACTAIAVSSVGGYHQRVRHGHFRQRHRGQHCRCCPGRGGGH
ncbi:hypothetical protein ACFST9_15115 [Hymenobacter monticola]|uniref:Uncharacterized protein n=1 Tax=Hymenobacter monticola TaxID=1705399 RepID=A0ABY4B1N9_9BACT|nr:hypothetical protein [Hymenobacter monticola]UOE32754.1 hypothetical protein MTP16_16660 [Hymenobacter monticola]